MLSESVIVPNGEQQERANMRPALANVVQVCRILVIAVSGVWLVVTVLGDISRSTSAPVLYREGWFFPGAIVVTLLGCVVPLLLSLWLVQRARRAWVVRTTARGLNFATAWKWWLFQWILLAVIVGCSYCFYFFERIVPVSIMPFSTSFGAVVFILAGLWLMQSWQARPRITVVAIYTLLILSTRFVDWNSRKPFVRDLLRLREGMTGQQVKGIMGRYVTNQDAADVSQANATLYYRHGDRPEYNADWGRSRCVTAKSWRSSS